ncbi:K+-transporting ATPase ATPase C chain [Clostridium cavendishii DSM 21758]|uniref:Potassium-transporting ATPase KdpC subunit n=1 Tax=Clostridium cavendishii DSM 21758 TaxID=1121302 RepID=A0A1M6T611_9CLOT|nr:potassium-transporting ATPase subunit KdpC [Clostridium cavendishii]SHK52421.1 K+-transporting ATPase ATPase C chain [Clostridium cavendishii DSM 21758]
MKKIITTSLTLCIALIVLCGFIYPLIVTGISQVAFKDKANGSLAYFNGKVVGSKMLGQNFTDERFFRSRPSSINYNTYTEEDTKPDKDGKTAYGGIGSGGSNYSNGNPALKERVEKDMEDFLKSHPTVKKEDIPTDLLTASGSGLDPNITPASAKIQIDAVSKASGISKGELEKLISKCTDSKSLGILGEERVNVLMLNLEVANILKSNGKL